MEGAPSGYVLVIDDQKGLRLLLTEVLGRMGITVRTAASGPEGIALAREEVPSLALVDMKMPGMDGLDALQALRADGIQCPCRLMTGLDRTDPRTRAALALPAVELLIKPFDVQAIRELVQGLFDPTERPPREKATPFS